MNSSIAASSLFLTSALLSSWTFVDTCHAFTPRPLASSASASTSLLHSRRGIRMPDMAIKITPFLTSLSVHATVLADDSKELPPVPLLPLISNPVMNDDPPVPGAIMKMLPRDTWHVSTPISLVYFFIDVAAVITSMSFLNAVVTSDLYNSLPVLEQGALVLPLQILTGFAMWCTWCIGHDAGHGTISKSKEYGKVINRLVGEISHSVFCLTPFLPWQLSHRKHHLNHNHLERDYSHQWYIREESDDLHPVIRTAHSVRMLFFPFLYFFYLVTGVPDGGHVFFYGRMWDGHSLKEKMDAAISVVVSFVTAGVLWSTMGTANFAVVCMVPWMVMSFWLFMVTYLQHHSHDGKLYTDETFTFQRGAFETVDRDYGKWVNRLSHHMMDGHVVHHLFFTKVPHYRLEAATAALREGMKKRGQEHLYKQIDTPNYSQEIVRQFYDNWFFINEDQVVR
eukprot:CAMPEP_0172420472 /NCGR_PEP_ID=MMETSP1064-20121228/6833_1 /TAXON_ID=202472 /ORGANISM="Aulacoseira subarctica , Strain CCAP 1002/5" /LENGTH=451 /DNA_ID=CAMNT_0013160445 /DNA_START=61 /DNA_END=1416 /DNA_ORIENTATION=+